MDDDAKTVEVSAMPFSKSENHDADHHTDDEDDAETGDNNDKGRVWGFKL